MREGQVLAALNHSKMDRGCCRSEMVCRHSAEAIRSRSSVKSVEPVSCIKVNPELYVRSSPSYERQRASPAASSTRLYTTASAFDSPYRLRGKPLRSPKPTSPPHVSGARQDRQNASNILHF
jgi:hypothetical protein